MKTFRYTVILLLIFLISFCCTLITRAIGNRARIVDIPNPPLKTHPYQTPLLGGIAIFLACIIAVIILKSIGEFTVFESETDPYYGLSQPYMNLRNFPNILKNAIPLKNILGIFIASIILLIGGFLDDWRKLRPSFQFIFPVLAAITVIASGIGIRTITNPLTALGISGAPLLNLAELKFKIIELNGIPYFFTIYSDIFTFIWLLGMMYTTKFLDGLDGLVAGMSALGFIFLFIISALLGQPLVAAFSLILVASTTGFLILNFHPSKIFLGEFGSTWLGFMLGVLAILGEARVSITMLIMGIPVLDVCWVIARRIFYEKKSPFKGDRKHLHFRLLDKGFSHKQAVLFLYILSAAFGLIGLFLQEKGRIMVFFFLVAAMVTLGFWITKKTAD